MITVALLMVAFWACTNTPLGEMGGDVQQAEIVNSSSFYPVYEKLVD